MCRVWAAPIGAIGAVVLATVLPGLIRSFVGATGAERHAVALTFSTLIDAVHRGLWQTLEAIPASVWFLITGIRLRRAGVTVAGWVPVVLAVFGFATSLGWMIDVPVVVVVALPVFLLFPLWVLWVGLWLLRGAPLPHR